MIILKNFIYKLLISLVDKSKKNYLGMSKNFKNFNIKKFNLKIKKSLYFKKFLKRCLL